LRRLGLEASDIVLTGGGAKSVEWRQIVADVCQLPVSLLSHDEGASLGAALQALWVLARQDDATIGIEKITGEHLTLRPEAGREPDEGNADRYRDGYAAYQQAIAALAPVFAINGAQP
jgi:xylulokinase